jgi:hypothetical protein
MFLGDAVSSVQRTAGASCRIVVPETQVAELRSRFPAATVVAEAGEGMFLALNTGFRSAGDWRIGTCLNDDDLLNPEGVREGMAAFADPKVGIVFGRVGLIDASGGRIGELPVCHNGRDLLPLLARGIMPLAHPGTLFRRRTFEDLGGFDGSYRSAGDLDFFVRALLKGLTFRFVNRHVADFRLHAGQVSKDETLAEREKARALVPLAGRGGGLGSLLRFRASNLGVYLGRMLRHGPVDMKTLYRKVT